MALHYMGIMWKRLFHFPPSIHFMSFFFLVYPPCMHMLGGRWWWWVDLLFAYTKKTEKVWHELKRLSFFYYTDRTLDRTHLAFSIQKTQILLPKKLKNSYT